MCDEAESFATRCHSKALRWQRLRRWARFRRGLVVTLRWRPKSLHSAWGVGHLLIAAYELHAACLLRLRRYCYLQLFDSELERHFGYAAPNLSSAGLDGSWRWDPSEAVRYPLRGARSLTLTFNVTQRNREGFIETHVLPRLENITYPLVYVHLYGYPPNLPAGSFALLRDSLASSGSAVAAITSSFALDPCLCRYVTQPRNATTALMGTPPDIAVHMRTGFADADSSASRRPTVASDPRETDRWLAAACGANGPAWGARATSGGGEAGHLRRLVISDSPGLLRRLRSRYPDVVAPGAAASTRALCPNDPAPSTRSWLTCSAAKAAALDDVIAASLASTLQVAPQRAVHSAGARFGALVAQRQWSAFLWPIVLRSMCLRTVAFTVPECPHFGETFVRNLHIWLPPEGFSDVGRGNSSSSTSTSMERGGPGRNNHVRARWHVGSAWAYRMLRQRGLNATYDGDSTLAAPGPHAHHEKGSATPRPGATMIHDSDARPPHPCASLKTIAECSAAWHAALQ